MPVNCKTFVMESYSVLSEFWKLLIEQLRKSGLPVTLLVIGVWATWELRQTDRKELTESFQLMKLETGLEIKGLRKELEECNSARMKMYFELAEVKAQLNYLTAERHK